MVASGKKWGKMEDSQMFWREPKCTDKKDRVPPPSKFGSELNEEVTLTPEVEKYITTYPLADWKQLAVCNSLVRMRCNGFTSEHSRLDNIGKKSRGGRF